MTNRRSAEEQAITELVDRLLSFDLEPEVARRVLKAIEENQLHITNAQRQALDQASDLAPSS